jgi:ATP-dependent DNA helicase DinG
VFSILDSRASERYLNDILAALPDMPVTDRIEDVGRFILSHKDESYFA